MIGAGSLWKRVEIFSIVMLYVVELICLNNRNIFN